MMVCGRSSDRNVSHVTALIGMLYSLWIVLLRLFFTRLLLALFLSYLSLCPGSTISVAIGQVPAWGIWMGGALLLFFFQAEDGIRDKLVTGVQTCALPIFELFHQHFLPLPAVWLRHRYCSLARRHSVSHNDNSPFHRRHVRNSGAALQSERALSRDRKSVV